MSKIQKNQYYNSNLDSKEYASYKSAQIIRHNLKMHKKRVREEYEICFDQFKDIIKIDSKMICLGTRNNYERDMFAELSCDINLKVYSQDIAEKSNADFIGDFNNLSEFVPNDWDVIYSNSLDHVIDASKALREWMGVLKKNGIMVLGFSFDDVVSNSDCNSFDKDSLYEFMSTENRFKILASFRAVDYDYYIIKKID